MGGYCSVNSLEQGSGLELLGEMSEMTPLLSSETDRLVLDGAANSYLAQARLGGNHGPRLEKYGPLVRHSGVVRWLHSRKFMLSV